MRHNYFPESGLNKHYTLYRQTTRIFTCGCANYITYWTLLASSNATHVSFFPPALKGNKDTYPKLKECWSIVYSAVYQERIKPRPQRFPIAIKLWVCTNIILKQHLAPGRWKKSVGGGVKKLQILWWCDFNSYKAFISINNNDSS